MGWRLIVGINDCFGVPVKNDNGRMVISFCAERRLSVNNAYFEHKNLFTYTRVARGQDGVEV